MLIASIFYFHLYMGIIALYPGHVNKQKKWPGYEATWVYAEGTGHTRGEILRHSRRKTTPTSLMIVAIRVPHRIFSWGGHIGFSVGGSHRIFSLGGNSDPCFKKGTRLKLQRGGVMRHVLSPMPSYLRHAFRHPSSLHNCT